MCVCVWGWGGWGGVKRGMAWKKTSNSVSCLIVSPGAVLTLPPAPG